MTLHFQREVEKLKKMLLNEAAFVEDCLKKAVKALKDRDEVLATEVKNSDNQIDRMEIELEEEALKILALHQPVAIDLRFLVSVIKINNDLERIGDLTANLASRTKNMTAFSHLTIAADIFRMAEIALQMLKDSLDALVKMDAHLAEKVCAADEQVDDLHKEMFAWVQAHITADVYHIDFYLLHLGVSRYLERIADHATNIAEDVLYMITGEISRHRSPDDTL